MLVRNLRCDICGEDYEEEIPSECTMAYEPEGLILPYRKSEGISSQKKIRDVCYNCFFKISDFIHALGYEYEEDIECQREIKAS